MGTDNIEEKSQEVDEATEVEQQAPAKELSPEVHNYQYPDEIKVCPVCGVDIQKYALGEWGGYKYISCKSCGSVMADPPVTQEEIALFLGEVQPETVHVPNHQRTVERLKKLLEKHFPERASKTFLDVGIGQGYAVAAAKEAGFKSVKGIDPYEFHVAFAKKHYDPELFEQSTLEEYADRGEQVDVVLCFNNLCEQPDPAGYIEALAKVVAKGGKVFFEEPDGNSFFLPRRFERWLYLEPPINSIFLSRKGLTALLKKNGFKVSKRFFTWSPFDRFIATKVK